MRRLAVGILAHVDAGKTTLIESLLFESGMRKKLGRVDNQDAFLDTEELERSRGITIFSKQAMIQDENIAITLLDTPGHVDFSAEMERCLWVMDYAVLVISGADGIQGHTLTLWKLLKQREIPVFVFINKMDQEGTDAGRLLAELRKEFGDGCIDFSNRGADFEEQIAVCEEALMERYLEGAAVTQEDIASLVRMRKVFPCYFGSALKLQGIHHFLKDISALMQEQPSSHGFGARVFKIARDQQGNRLTYLKVTSGVLKVKDVIGQEEKVNQIRLYSGEKYETIQEAEPGMVCAVTGLSATRPGMGLGVEKENQLPVLEPVLTYRIELPEEMDAARMLPMLRQLEEEEPELHIAWQEQTGSILIQLMGEVQIDVVKKQIENRFGITIGFGTGEIVYKETIREAVEGVGHFEPLRHYAEVHLLMEPGEPGSGMQFLSCCSEDILDKNWQRLILTHLEEKEHVGVLTGSAITDMRITVVAGKAHTKHTEGGDFRQATYRAVRQGLMQAETVLLEPYYNFQLRIPAEHVGRAMTDLQRMCANFDTPSIEEGWAELVGTAPVVTMQGYQVTVSSYTKGKGKLFCSLKGYEPCHNTEEVVERIRYQPEEDVENPSCSVFCSHGAGYLVPWNQVKEHMHVDSGIFQESSVTVEEMPSEIQLRKARLVSASIDEEQIEEILNRTFHSNERAAKHYKKQRAQVDTGYRGRDVSSHKERYLIVDGYNIVHAWEDLKTLAQDNLDGARMKLLDVLCNYQAFIKCELIVVFDAYRVKGNLGEMFDYHNIHVVYTKEAETADAYIEKLTHHISKEYQVTVATSDGLVQLITRGQNCMVLSARELKEEIDRTDEQIRSYLIP